ncbi:MAG: M48 family metalloprotease [Alphaproteobacteria bacterium]|nr:M48 family metalloprotease [Alphaproteobacteria bacterium]
MKRILSFFLFLIICSPVFAVTEIRDTEIELGLEKLIKPIAVAANIPDGRVRVHIIANDEFNAFVTSGEDVFIYTGLLTRIKSAEALQAVVAHEMGHMIGGHITQMSGRMRDEMTRTMIMQALGVGLMVANPSAGAGLLMGSSGISRQSLLAFTRDEERLADDLAIDLLIKAEIDPNGLVQVLNQMQELTGDIETKINPYNKNHPLISERLNNVKEKIKSKPRTKRKIEINVNYEIIRAKLIGYLQTENQVENLYPSKNKSDAAIYARAIRYMRSGNLKSAKISTQELISRHPKNPYFYELLGDIEYQFGHYDDSVLAYEKSLEIQKNAPQIQTALALVLTERNKVGDKDKAIQLAKRSILTEPMHLSYLVLIKAYGDDARSDWAYAEYYNMLKQEKKMRKYAKSAQSRLPKNSPEYIKAGDLLR